MSGKGHTRLVGAKGASQGLTWLVELCREGIQSFEVAANSGPHLEGRDWKLAGNT